MTMLGFTKRILWGLVVYVSILGTARQGVAGEQILQLALNPEPAILDPRFGTDVPSARVSEIVTNGLVKKDSQLNLVPCLAERWENPDAKTYVFYLRKGVKFHDGTHDTNRRN
jgi:peptide/nickel transport system substrate-binding protein